MGVLCEDNLKKLGRLNPNQRIVEDPGMYRPSTPILEWQAPKRSANPPKLPMWVVIALCSGLAMAVTGLAPHWLSEGETKVFLCVFIPASTVIISLITYMSITRHLQDMVALMMSINAPIDMDRVVEKLENGRFSRLREPWFVQVHTIRMFCRLLKYHHGVNPVSGEMLPQHVRAMSFSAGPKVADDASECESAALYSCFSGGSLNVAGGVASQLGKHSANAFASSTNRRPREADPLGDNSKGWDQVMGAAPENKNLIFEILKQIKPGMEMSKIPLPAHILEPRSLLERISDMFAHPDLFGAIVEAPNSIDRITRILRWFMSSLHVRPRGLKKPYNPILGETFECLFAQGTPDEVHYFAEQVGHHPPVSVFTAVHIRSGLSVTGSYMLKGRLVSPNCACISVEGRLELTIPPARPNTGDEPIERWSMAFPNVYVSSLLTTPRIEAGGDIKFVSSRGDISADLSFVRKPFFGGAYDDIKGTVFGKQRGQPLYAISGKWSELSQLESADGARKITLFDTSVSPPPLRPFVPPTVCPNPSRVMWAKVTEALRSMDSEAAQNEKNSLEASQREVRRAREARGEEYLPKFFRIVNEKKGPADDQWVYIGPDLTAPVEETRSPL